MLAASLCAFFVIALALAASGVWLLVWPPSGVFGDEILIQKMRSVVGFVIVTLALFAFWATSEPPNTTRGGALVIYMPGATYEQGEPVRARAD